MITIIDYKMGNVGSILNMLRKFGAEARVSGNDRDILSADKLILPGVGAFDHGMRNLRDSGLVPILDRKVRQDKTLILGICLGMQLMSTGSEEGHEVGLGWLDATCVRFDPAAAESPIKVPHMGWNTVQTRPGGPIWLNDNARFYFTHSYHLRCHTPDNVLGWTTYGYPFAAAVRQDNILGVQFHPEKSHRFGLGVLRAFAEA
jgi:imidazole glycerol-phosphate synthase subunit HisH